MSVVAWLAVVIAPLSAGAALFLWRLHQDDVRDNGPEPRWRLSLVLALTGTVSAIAAVWLGSVALLMLLEQQDLVRRFGGFTVTALLVLDGIPIVNALYLRWLRGQAQ